tara:strand:- start:37 stop:459 length:423 start_codon:yes stop_codon:yes gene_type:complete
MSNLQILEDVTLTEKNSIQHNHYGKSGNSKKFHKLLKKHNLRTARRDDPTGHYHMGEALSEYVVAPIFDKDGNKICWGMYHPDDSFAKFRTKQHAMSHMRALTMKEEPWYSDLPGYDTTQGVYLSDGVYGHANWKFTGNI